MTHPDLTHGEQIALLQRHLHSWIAVDGRLARVAAAHLEPTLTARGDTEPRDQAIQPGLVDRGEAARDTCARLVEERLHLGVEGDDDPPLAVHEVLYAGLRHQVGHVPVLIVRHVVDRKQFWRASRACAQLRRKRSER